MAEFAPPSAMSEVQDLVAAWRKEGATLVLTNGVFDVFHVGHVGVLESAAAEGDKLIVVVNTDVSVKRLGKGPDRPLNHESDRMAVLAALRCVDAVVLFDEDTPLSVVETLKPNVLVKGGDYDALETDPSHPRYIVGSAEVRASGGRVVVVPVVPGKSSTEMIERIRRT